MHPVKRIKAWFNTTRFRRGLYPLGVTIAFYAVALLIAGQFQPTSLNARREALLDVIALLPYLFLLISAFLGLQLNQTRIFYLSLLLGAAYWFSVTSLAVPLALRGQIVALALPFSFALNFIIRESKLTGKHGLLRVLAIVLPGLVLYLGARYHVGFIITFLKWQWMFYVKNWVLPDFTLIFFVTFAAAMVWRSDRYIRDFTVPFLAAFLPLFFVFNKMGAYPVVGALGAAQLRFNIFIYYGLTATVLLVALFRLYWQKVYIDELSGIPNRRALNERLPKLGKRYCIAMVDIDHFKKFNDTFGHDEGDNVIRFVSRHLDEGSNSCAYRYGGEEFCIVFEDAYPDKARAIAENIRRGLAKRRFFIRSPKAVRESTTHRDRGSVAETSKRIVTVTVSIGLSYADEGRSDPDQVIKAADRALYVAKKKGRNRVELEE